MAAGSFREGKTGGFGSFRCLCMGTLTPMHLPNTPLPVSSTVPPPCAECPLPGDKEPCFFKTWRTNCKKQCFLCTEMLLLCPLLCS